MKPPGQKHGLILPDYRRIHRATEPDLTGVIPALNEPVENANQTRDKANAALNRGGSGLRNPILNRLGVTVQLNLDQRDFLTGIFIFQNRADIGANLAGGAVLVAPPAR